MRDPFGGPPSMFGSFFVDDNDFFGRPGFSSTQRQRQNQAALQSNNARGGGRSGPSEMDILRELMRRGL